MTASGGVGLSPFQPCCLYRSSRSFAGRVLPLRGLSRWNRSAPARFARTSLLHFIDSRCAGRGVGYHGRSLRLPLRPPLRALARARSWVRNRAVGASGRLHEALPPRENSP